MNSSKYDNQLLSLLLWVQNLWSLDCNVSYMHQQSETTVCTTAKNCFLINEGKQFIWKCFNYTEHDGMIKFALYVCGCFLSIKLFASKHKSSLSLLMEKSIRWKYYNYRTGPVHWKSLFLYVVLCGGCMYKEKSFLCCLRPTFNYEDEKVLGTLVYCWHQSLVLWILCMYPSTKLKPMETKMG